MSDVCFYYSAEHNAFLSAPDNDPKWKVWPDLVPVGSEQMAAIKEAMAAGGTLTSDQEGNPVVIAASPQPVDIREVFEQWVAELNNDYERAVAKLKSTYPLSEAITWPVQLAEALAIRQWQQSNPGLSLDEIPPTLAPFLITLNASRTREGVPGGLDHLVTRVLENNSLFTPALAHVTAIRHSAELQAEAAVENNDLDALLAITYDFWSGLSGVEIINVTEPENELM